MLSDGQSSRIYRKLVYEKQLALAAFGGGNIIEDPNLFFAVAIVQPGKTPEEATNALIAELDRLQQRADLRRRSCSRPRTSSRATTSSAASRTRSKAEQLGHAVVIHNDIKTADGEFDIFQNMTAADVQRVARTYFTPENRTGADDHAEGPATGGGPMIAAAARVGASPALVAASLRGARGPRPPRRRTGRRSGRRGRSRRATSSSRPTRSRRCRTGCR